MRQERSGVARIVALCVGVVGCSASPSPGVQTGTAIPPAARPPARPAPDTRAPAAPPALTSTPAPAVAVSDVSVGESHVCALASDGHVWCWGWNDSKQVAATSVDQYASPVRIALPLSATDIAVGDRVSCAILSDGRRACWGYRRALTIESSQRFERLVPTWPANCALNSRRELVCGGYNYFGVLGFPVTERGEFQKNLPVRPVPLPEPVEQVATAGDLGCALVGPERKLFCWGNGWGCSGPRPLDLPAQMTALSGGGVRVCLLAANGDVHQFSEGHERYGVSDEAPDPYTNRQFCHDSDEGLRPPPSKIAEGATQVSCFARMGANCSACSGCIVDRQQRLLCWQDDAELRGSMVVPTLVQGVSHPKRIAAGDAFYCALLESGLLQCWGKNGFGQLGRGHVSAVEATPMEPAWPLTEPDGKSLAPAGE